MKTLNKRTIIAIHGPKGTGKTTLANVLQNLLKTRGIQSNVVSFATPIKAHVKSVLFELFGMEIDGILKDDPCIRINGRSRKSGLFSARLFFALRDLYRRVGMRAREGDPNCWIEKLESYIRECEQDVFIIDDMRFENELDWVNNQQSLTISISRDGIPFDDKDEAEKPLNCDAYASLPCVYSDEYLRLCNSLVDRIESMHKES